MDAPTFQLLDYAVEAWVPVHWLTKPMELSETLNKPYHGLNQQDLQDALYKLLAHGDLIARRQTDSAFIYEMPRKEGLLAIFDRPFLDTPDLCYGLTAQGGRQWEAIVRPRWQYYLDCVYDQETNTCGTGKIQGSDIQVVQSYLDSQTFVASWVQTIRAESIIWIEHQPWQATYWKGLPRGCEVQFKYQTKAIDVHSQTIPPTVPPEMELLLHHTYHWYDIPTPSHCMTWRYRVGTEEARND